MLFSFFICYFSFPNNRLIYKGNYTSGNITTGFLFHFYANKTLCPKCSRLIFQPNNTRLFPFSSIQLYGIYSSDLTSFFYFGCLGKTISQTKIIEIIAQGMKNLNLTEPTNHDLLHKETYRLFGKSFPPAFFFAFNIFNSTELYSTFYSHTKAIGKIYISNSTTFTFSAFQFDELLYVSEGKIFGLVSSFSIVLLYFSWQYLIDHFNSMAQLSQLSVHTFTMQVSFDFVYGVFLFQLSDSNIHLTNLYNILFSFVILIYFFLETRELTEIWRFSLGDLDNVNLFNAYAFFFFEITVIVSIYSSAMSYVFSYPYIWIPIMFSYLIPQIYHSFKTVGRKKNDTLFNVLSAIARLIPVFYFACHRPNIMSCYDPYVAVIATVFIFVQIFIVFLQNTFGGSFFMPKRFRPVPFDYSIGTVEADTNCPICFCEITPEDEIMVTPCNHAFHKNCLKRWMEQQLICPVCRARIPPIEV